MKNVYYAIPQEHEAVLKVFFRRLREEDQMPFVIVTGAYRRVQVPRPKLDTIIERQDRKRIPRVIELDEDLNPGLSGIWVLEFFILEATLKLARNNQLRELRPKVRIFRDAKELRDVAREQNLIFA